MNDDDFDFPDVDLNFPEVVLEPLNFDDIEIPSNLKPSQRRFLRVFICARGTIEEMASKARISPRTYYHWRANDPDFNEALGNVKAEMEDVAKSVLIECIQRRNAQATIFYLKKYGGPKWGTTTDLPRKGRR